MTDLISREAAIALLESIIDETCPEAWNGGVEACLEALTNMPSADTLATNEINALKDALAQAEGEIENLRFEIQYPGDEA